MTFPSDNTDIFCPIYKNSIYIGIKINFFIHKFFYIFIFFIINRIMRNKIYIAGKINPVPIIRIIFSWFGRIVV